jgi:hypothetical protein
MSEAVNEVVVLLGRKVGRKKCEFNVGQNKSKKMYIKQRHQTINLT